MSGLTSYGYPCYKSVLLGGGRVTYPGLNDRLRSNESFRTRIQSHHHNQKGRSIIEELSFDLVKAIPVDYMHNVCIGVEKKILQTWISGKMNGTRISKEPVKLVSDFLVYIKKYVPIKFPRKTRTLDDFKQLKAPKPAPKSFTLLLSRCSSRGHFPKICTTITSYFL